MAEVFADSLSFLSIKRCDHLMCREGENGLEPSKNQQIHLVIPAYEPTEKMVDYVLALQRAGFSSLLVVDDGSSPEKAPIFAQLEALGCQVLHHSRNRGKGAALKTAFRALLHQKEGKDGVITVDCDGQHGVDDVQRMARALTQAPDTLVLGCRKFDRDTPLRSRMGNRLTSLAMGGLYHIHLQDTQTGLRGFSSDLLEAFLKLPGERYEYELNILLHAKACGIPYTVVPIQTLYFEENAGSHYRPVADSLRILGHLLKGAGQYLLSSTVSALVDVLLYGLLVKWIFVGIPLVSRVLWAAIVARLLSSVVNYAGNRRMPTVQNHTIGGTLWKYYVLWLFQLAASVAGTYALCRWLGMDELLAKLLVDLLLALASYQIQLRWVFAKGPEQEPSLPRWNLFGRLIKKLARLCFRQPLVDASGPCQGPTVYVVHHQNLRGPVRAVAALPGNPHIWTLHVFLQPRACFQQYYRYTFTQRFGWPRPLAWAAARLLQWVVPSFLHSIGAVPVFRKSAHLRQTLDTSLDLLCHGESLVICPDVNYADPSPQTGQIYTGFLALEKGYHRRTGRHLPFVPVYCGPGEIPVTLGRPVYCTEEPGQRPREVRQQAAKQLIRQLNQMAGQDPALSSSNVRARGSLSQVQDN